MSGNLKTIFVAVCLVFLSSTYGCSVHSAANQPDEKNINLLSAGTSRAELLAEFGTPIHTEIKDGKKTDIFTFLQGYSTGTKSSRGVFHGAADVLTLGLWELVGGSIEGAYDGEKMSFQVMYDENDKVQDVSPLNKEAKKEVSPVVKSTGMTDASCENC